MGAKDLEETHQREVTRGQTEGAPAVYPLPYPIASGQEGAADLARGIAVAVDDLGESVGVQLFHDQGRAKPSGVPPALPGAAPGAATTATSHASNSSLFSFFVGPLDLMMTDGPWPA